MKGRQELFLLWPQVAAAGLFLCVIALVKLNMPAACTEIYKAEAVVQTPDSRIRVELADNQAELLRGLSGRSCIGDNQGMLFVFQRPGFHHFWMKEMNFPIDIVWLDENKKVIEVTAELSPETYPNTVTSSRPASYVLELGAGVAARQGIADGVRLSF